EVVGRTEDLERGEDETTHRQITQDGLEPGLDEPLPDSRIVRIIRTDDTMLCHGKTPDSSGGCLTWLNGIRSNECHCAWYHFPSEAPLASGETGQRARRFSNRQLFGKVM